MKLKVFEPKEVEFFTEAWSSIFPSETEFAGFTQQSFMVERGAVYSPLMDAIKILKAAEEGDESVSGHEIEAAKNPQTVVMDAAGLKHIRKFDDHAGTHHLVFPAFVGKYAENRAPEIPNPNRKIDFKGAGALSGALYTFLEGFFPVSRDPLFVPTCFAEFYADPKTKEDKFIRNVLRVDRHFPQPVIDKLGRGGVTNAKFFSYEKKDAPVFEKVWTVGGLFNELSGADDLDDRFPQTVEALHKALSKPCPPIVHYPQYFSLLEHGLEAEFSLLDATLGESLQKVDHVTMLRVDEAFAEAMRGPALVEDPPTRVSERGESPVEEGEAGRESPVDGGEAGRESPVEEGKAESGPVVAPVSGQFLEALGRREEAVAVVLLVEKMDRAPLVDGSEAVVEGAGAAAVE